ncbi:MAG: phosphopantetheine-binding protein [Candidatus Cryptobacteroides sp.]
MNREEITAKLKDILVEEFEVDREELADDAPLMKTLDLDSLDLVDMVVLIEKYFRFKMKKEDFAVIRTFGDLCEAIDANVD